MSAQAAAARLAECHVFLAKRCTCMSAKDINAVYMDARSKNLRMAALVASAVQLLADHKKAPRPCPATGKRRGATPWEFPKNA